MVDERFSRSYDVTVVPVRSEMFLVRRSQAFRVNETGLHIWNRLEGDVTGAELAVDVAAKYGIDEAVASRDVEEFIQELKQRRLVEVD